MPDKYCCPSFYALPGALLLGRVGGDGRVGILRKPIPVDESFLLQLRSRGIEPESVFRFAGPCHQAACGHWRSGQCQLIRQLSHAPPSLAREAPACGIRHVCRWHSQEGTHACRLCPFVTRLTAAPSGFPVPESPPVPSGTASGHQSSIS